MMSWLRELQILTMLTSYMQIPTMLATTDMAICIAMEIYIAIQMKQYRAAIIIDSARNYVLAFKIWQTHATDIHVIRVATLKTV